MSRLRLEALAGMPVLPVTEAALSLAGELLRKGILPRQAVSDAIHASIASSEGIQTLLTWNCRHLANPFILRQLRVFMGVRGLTLPEVCTLIELEGN